MPSEEWRLSAACRGLGPDLFFPLKEEGVDNHGNEAKEICCDCPVRIECLDAGVRNNEEGIWGGIGRGRRRAVRQAFASGDPNLYRRALIEETAEIGRVVRGYVDDAPAAPARPCSRCDAMVPATEAGSPHPLDRNGPKATCGKASTYNKGCRCSACDEAKKAYYQKTKKDPPVPARGRSKVAAPEPGKGRTTNRRTAS